MSHRRLRERIARRSRNSGLDIPGAVLDGLEAYFSELARWNSRVNLTSLNMNGDGDDESVDRLLIEPLIALQHLPPRASSLLDVGSGGGSPAIPMKIGRPDLALTMVEVKVRKSVFLRQVSRTLGLSRTSVENARFEELLTRPDLHESVDAVSVRAVRLRDQTWLGIQAFVRPGGLILNFSATTAASSPPPPLRLVAAHPLVPGSDSRLQVIMKGPIGRRST